MKIGMARDAETIVALGQTLEPMAENVPVVCAPGILSFENKRLIDDTAVEALVSALIPQSLLLVLRCNEAEVVLQRSINSDEDMAESAAALHKMGARWVMLRGGLQTQGRCTALLSDRKRNASLPPIMWTAGVNTVWVAHLQQLSQPV